MRTLSLRPRSLAPLALTPVLVVVLAACSSGSTPEPSAAPGSSAPGSVSTADEAVALVLAQDPRFERIQPYDPDLIGQAAWTRVEPAPDGWTVTVRIGWGDCPSGCIDEHLWTYEVTNDGEVSLVDEEGPEVPADVTDIP